MPQQTPNAGGNRRPTKQLPELKIAAIGDYHSDGVCALCGLLASEAPLKRTVLAMTRAEAMRCVDVVACCRRIREQAA
jgi:hypothetical protein